MRHPDVASRVAPLIEAGLVATTAALDAEVISSARNPAEYEQLWADHRVAYEYLPAEDEHWQAALQAQRELARQGRHRAVGMPDLLTAVLAAAHGLTVVHYDADFQTAATVVAFEQVWVMPRGGL
jgi:predicted nucleic acid-binding protein